MLQSPYPPRRFIVGFAGYFTPASSNALAKFYTQHRDEQSHHGRRQANCILVNFAAKNFASGFFYKLEANPRIIALYRVVETPTLLHLQ